LKTMSTLVDAPPTSSALYLVNQKRTTADMVS
jgi:hypothetical protein